ncbi:tetratricopeptide repeat protein [Robertkochia aurantiaca]|uniref:tetratricopeptide repeat protein n=1 Tax=Robertkochia aurantiaca TaxID=2873700 RepID=UPI001CCBA770|nr:hypothetical protein [Robertkochia sp. 3YJGBD-33]
MKTIFLGSVSFEVSGDEMAAETFEEGLLLLHSFEYEDARQAFRQAIEEDPLMGMAYWGEAMTYNHPLWSEQETEKAREVLSKLYGNDKIKAEHPLEKDLIRSLSVLYEEDRTKAERDKNYAAFMKELYDKYPDNHEVGAFYALSLLGSVENGRDVEVYEQGANIASEILEENPEHPGALHYLIHSYDDPGHAHLALDAADAYARVAPDASHALHMPSHIYVAMGMWEQVVNSNEDSYQASLTRMNDKSLGDDARGYHAFHWLEYGLLQQGRFGEAEEMVRDMKGYMSSTPSKRARSHMVFLKGTYLVETNDWENPVADINVKTADLNVAVRSQYRFLEGMKAFIRKDENTLAKVIRSQEKDYQKESLQLENESKGFVSCSNITREATDESSLNLSKVMLYQLQGLLAWTKGDQEETEDRLKRSILVAESMSYSYGPPVVQKPPHELYADWLMSRGRYTEALKQYKKALKRAPGRTNALKGALNAAEKAGDEELAEQFRNDLHQNTNYKMQL